MKHRSVSAWLIGPAVLVILADVLLFVVMVTTGWYLSHDKHGSLFRKLCVVLSAGGGKTEKIKTVSI